MDIEWNVMLYVFTHNDLENLSLIDLAKLTSVPVGLQNVHISVLFGDKNNGIIYGQNNR